MSHILVVDDEVGIRDLLARFLAKQGHDVDVAKSGTEALRKIKQTPPDAVVLDLLLPKMSGLGVLRRINEDALEIGFVVVMSGQDHASSLGLDALDAGANHFLPKPFDLHILESLIAGGLKKAAGPQREEQRAHPRVEVALPIQIDFGTYGETAVGETVDLSRGGVQVIVDRDEPIGTHCSVRIPHAAETEPGMKDGIVIRSEPEGDRYRVAIQFYSPAA